MAKLCANRSPNPLLRFGNRNNLRMELDEFLEIWDCSDEEMNTLSQGWTVEELQDFSSVPHNVAYRLALFHQLWSRQIVQNIEQGQQLELEVSVPEPVLPNHGLWAELDELYAYDMTPREFQIFWQVNDWQLARILQVEIKQVQRYLKTPPNSPIPSLVCFFLGFLHRRWLEKLGQNVESPYPAVAASCGVVQMQ